MTRATSRFIRPRNPLRQVRKLADRVLQEIMDAIRQRPLAARRHHHAAEQVLRALLLQALSSTPNARLLRERLRRDALFRRFVGLRRGATLWTLPAFSLNRARLFEAGIAPLFFQRFLAIPNIVRVLRDERLMVDDVLLEAWTSQRGCADPANQPRLGSLLILPSVPDSLRYLPYLDVHDGRSPLDVALARLREGVPGQVAIACESATVAERLASTAAKHDARLLRLDPGSESTQLVSASAQLHVGHLAVFEPSAALLPVRVVRTMCQHHLRHCNDVTRLHRLPAGIGAAIYSSWYVNRMRAETPRTIDVAPDKWLAFSAEVEGGSLRLEDVRSIPCPEPAPEGLPLRVRIDEPQDWQRLATSVQRALKRPPVDEWRLVRTWRQSGWVRPGRGVRPKRRRERPRILYVSASTGFSGSERMFAWLTNGLLDKGCDLWGLTVRPGIIGRLLREPYRNRLIADGVEFNRPTLASFEYCLRMMRRLRPSLVHCNGFTGWPILAAAEACRLPVLQHVRIAELVAIEDDLRRADQFIAVSKFVAAELQRAGAPSDRIRLCYDGIDAFHFRRDSHVRTAARRLFGIEHNAFMLLCVSRIATEKRVEIVIQSFARAVRTCRKAYLFVVGEIESPLYFESLKRLIAERGLEGCVRFLSGVEDMRPVHAASDALILASLREPLGTAVLEALAMQTPVIASASGGIPEIVDESCGTLVDPDSPEEFAGALRRVVNQDRDMVRKALRGRAIVRRRFNLDDHVEAVRRIAFDVVG
jgi:glycosyltransferase involved in cell wall biosynthesis